MKVFRARHQRIENRVDLFDEDKEDPVEILETANFRRCLELSIDDFLTVLGRHRMLLGGLEEIVEEPLELNLDLLAVEAFAVRVRQAVVEFFQVVEDVIEVLHEFSPPDLVARKTISLVIPEEN